jgi:hypothetical protein
MAEKAVSTRIAERLIELKADLVPKVAALRRPVLGNVTVSADERHRRWWQEDKGWTAEKEQMLLASGMSREDVGLLKFPNREIDARAAGHGDVRKEAEYARDMSAMGPPAPEPLEAAALAVEQPAESDTSSDRIRQNPTLLPAESDTAQAMAPPPTLPSEVVTPYPPEGRVF